MIPPQGEGRHFQAETRKLNAESCQLNVNSKEYGEKEREFQKVNGKLKDLRGEINKTGGAFSKLADHANKYQQVLQMITVGVIGFGAAVVGIIKGNAKLEDSLADIRKTTKLTVDELKKLNAMSYFKSKLAKSKMQNGKMGYTLPFYILPFVL